MSLHTPYAPPISPMADAPADKKRNGVLSKKSHSKSSKKSPEEPFQVFTIPRVELWCKDPKCPFNGHEGSVPPSEASSGGAPWHSTELPSRYQAPPPPLPSGSRGGKSDDTRTTTMASTSSGRSSARYASVFDPVGQGSSRPRPPPPNSIALNPAQKRLPPLPDELNNSRNTGVQTSPTECVNGLTKHTKFPPGEKCAACQYSPLAQFPNCVCRLNGVKLTDADVVNPFWRFDGRHNFLSGGFTLNGPQDNGRKADGKMKRFCSSHKVALVVSTFSLLVTIGLVITLLFMKNKGMMEPM